MQNPHATNDNNQTWTAFSEILLNMRIRNAVLFLTGKESSAAVSAEFAGAGGRFAGLELTSDLSCASVSDKPVANRWMQAADSQAELVAPASGGLGGEVSPADAFTSLERVDVGIPKFLMAAPEAQEAAANG